MHMRFDDIYADINFVCFPWVQSMGGETRPIGLDTVETSVDFKVKSN